MSNNTSIQWTDNTWNPIVGCSRVSEGCKNCYAERMAGRLAAMGKRQYQDVVGDGLTYGPNAGWTGETALVESALSDPSYWKKGKRVFVCSMGDLFHPSVPFDWVDRVFTVMALCPRHTFQVLTKRPERMAEYFNYAVKFDNLEEEIARRVGWEGKWPRPTEGDWPLRNLWIGTSVENQAAADERIPHLLRCQPAVCFLSLEPLLGPVDLSLWVNDGNVDCSAPIHWVIVGGESGPKARPCDIAWIRSIRDQCAAAGVPCFVKQLGSNCHDSESGILGRQAPWDPELQGTYRRLRAPKGGDPAEWPADLLNVRQWPKEEQ